jgi:nicotinamidase-related amidase
VLILCDVWDRHWSRGASERVDVLAPRIDRFARAARERGVFVIHAPSERWGSTATTRRDAG